MGMLLPEDIQNTPQNNYFLLLDGALYTDLGATISDSGDDSPVVALYAGTRLQQNLAVSPRLLALRPNYQDSPILSDFLEHDAAKHRGILLQSDAGIEETARHLAWLCVAKKPDGRTVAFRYYDSRQLPGIYTATAKYKRGELLGPVSKVWTPLAGTESWTLLERPKLGRGASITEPDYSQTYELSQKQIQAMEDAQMNLFVADLGRDLEESFPHMLSGKTPEDVARFYTDKAQKFGFGSEQSIYDFCYLTSIMLPLGETPWTTTSTKINAIMNDAGTDNQERMRQALEICTGKME